jgi:hypothetical protein
MSEPNRPGTASQWFWAAMLCAAPAIAQDNAGKKTPPPIPQPPAKFAPAPKGQTPPMKTSGDPTSRDVSPAAKAIIDNLATKPEDEAARQREGMLAYQQALAAQQANRPGDALRLAKRAKQLFPSNADIAALAAQLQRESGAGKLASPSTTKAKAYLAAGYSRGSELLRAGQTAQGEDMLLGVVEASKLFPDPGSVDYYRRLADGELAQFRLAQANGTLPQNGKGNPKAVPPEAPEPRPIAPPENIRRLIRTPDAPVPSWYVQQKNRLATSMSVDYKRISAADALEDIAAKTGVEFIIDRPVALARTHVNSTVDFRAGDVTAEFILDLVSQKAGFEYVLMERSIVITTRSKALEYLRLLPEALRNNWLVARTLFPEVAGDLIAAQPGPAPTLPTGKEATQPRPRNVSGDLPPHLQSGRALVAAIQVLLK